MLILLCCCLAVRVRLSVCRPIWAISSGSLSTATCNRRIDTIVSAGVVLSVDFSGFTSTSSAVCLPGSTPFCPSLLCLELSCICTSASGGVSAVGRVGWQCGMETTSRSSVTPHLWPPIGSASLCSRGGLLRNWIGPMEFDEWPNRVGRRLVEWGMRLSFGQLELLPPRGPLRPLWLRWPVGFGL